MNKKPFYRRPWFACTALIIFCLVSYAAVQALRPTSYQLFQRIKIGDTFASITDMLGQPEDSHTTTNGTDYTFVVFGDPEYPKLMGVPFPVHRIVRISGGLVVSKGSVEDYYEPHTPGWGIELPPRFLNPYNSDAVTNISNIVALAGPWNRKMGTNEVLYQWNLPEGIILVARPDAPFQPQSRLGGLYAYRSTNDFPEWFTNE